jgi:hypothetical protein
MAPGLSVYDVSAFAMGVWVSEHWHQREVSSMTLTVYLPIADPVELRDVMDRHERDARNVVAIRGNGKLRLLEHVEWWHRVGDKRKLINRDRLPVLVHKPHPDGPEHYLDCIVQLLTLPAPPLEWWRPTVYDQR